ncbi:MAG: glycosyltransferase family 1 protein [Pseudanabaena sp. ELA645]
MKILYDITILGNNFSQTDPKTGIYRVTEELLLELLKKEDIETTLASLCSPDPALSSINCHLYIKDRIEVDLFNFEDTFQSHLGLNWLYRLLYGTYFSRDFQKPPKYSLKSIPVRGILKLLEITKLYMYDRYQYCNSDKYDILHSTYYKLPSEELTKNLPRLLMVHDLIPIKSVEFVSKQLIPYFDSILKSINYNKDWIVCNSEYTRQEFCEYTGMNYEKTFVTHLAADKQFYPITNSEIIQTINQRYNIPENNYFLCLASQLEPRKNIPHLINSFVDLITEHPNLDVNLVLIGTTRYRRAEIEHTLQQISQYKGRIIITGYVPDKDLSAIYSGATAFVFPSLYEGFGLPILEAMQCGTPVISSNSTSLPEVVGDAGILIDPKDKAQLCQAMLNVLNDETLRDNLKQKGLERAKQFSWEKCANETVEIYKKIIASK